MARDAKPKKGAAVAVVKGVSVSDARRRKPSRKGREKEEDTNTKGNSDKTRQMQSSKEFEGGTETCHLNFKTNPAALDRDRPLSRLQQQRFEEFTRDAVKKGVKGILDQYGTNLKGYVPTDITRK
uniref:Uncharacterized protein n=1 Tax=Panagrolaimus sp. ES5 TaxID=591445 RepID=A0AC34G6G8_9BILA